MKKYTIHYNYYATAQVQVLANSEKEAILKARDVSICTDEFNFSLNEEDIVDQIDVPELCELMAKAEKKLKDADSLGNEVILDPWPKVTVQVWDGKRMANTYQTLENIYYDEDREEIGFETDYNSELTISDIPEIEQHNLCFMIINGKEVTHA